MKTYMLQVDKERIIKVLFNFGTYELRSINFNSILLLIFKQKLILFLFLKENFVIVKKILMYFP